MADIKTTDLNLLRALQALLDTRSVTRAAEQLGLTQPAVSGMLVRLREAFGEPLFVRTQRGILPTPRAEALREPLRAALAQLDDVLRPDIFDPAKLDLALHLAATDYAQKALVLPFMATLRDVAPGVRLAVRPVDVEQMTSQLEIGTLDMALVTPDMAAPSLRARRLFDETYVCILRLGHPAFAALDLDTFCRLDHAIMSHDGRQFRGATDAALATLGRARRVVAAVPSFLVLIELVKDSNVIALVPSRLVRDRADLHVVAPPIPVAGFTKILVWHERTQHDPAHAWFRDRFVHANTAPTC